MKLRGHGNGLAIALSGLAVVFAASGTAYAVTATAVNIADPTTPSRVAKVDSSGRLNTVEPLTTVNITAASYPTSDANHSGDVFSAPTSAPLAVSMFSVVPIGPLSATYSVYLFQVPVLADGSCSTTATNRTLGYAVVSPGSSGGQNYTTPIVVTPVGTAKYCLDVYYKLSSGTAGTESFGVQFTAYAVSGKYSGNGATEATPAAPRSKADAVAGR